MIWASFAQVLIYVALSMGVTLDDYLNPEPPESQRARAQLYYDC